MKTVELITNLRQSDEYIEHIFLHGSCYKFYLFLKTIWPNAEPYITKEKGHIVTKIGDDFYDINGYALRKDIAPMTVEDVKLARTWSFRKQNLLKLTECTICGEPHCYENGKKINGKKEQVEDLEAKTERNMKIISSFMDNYEIETGKKIPESVFLTFFNA